MKRYENIEAFVLAGGKSSRMEQDKGMMLLNGKPMISYVLDMMSSLQLSIKIIAGSDQYLQLGYEVIKDIVPGKGPMGGLYTAFNYSSKPYIFLISCDTPFIPAAAAERLLRAAENRQATVAEVLKKINPLFAVYHHSLNQEVSACIVNDQLKMQDFIFSVNHRLVNMDDLLLLNPNLFFNINDKTDFEKCSEWLKQKI